MNKFSIKFFTTLATCIVAMLEVIIAKYYNNQFLNRLNG